MLSSLVYCSTKYLVQECSPRHSLNICVCKNQANHYLFISFISCHVLGTNIEGPLYSNLPQSTRLTYLLLPSHSFPFLAFFPPFLHQSQTLLYSVHLQNLFFFYLSLKCYDKNSFKIAVSKTWHGISLQVCQFL